LSRCFDRKIGLRQHAPPAGFTPIGSPLFDCRERWPLRIATECPEQELLVLTLYLPPDFSGPFSATLHLASETGNFSWRLCRPPGWKQYPIPLRGLLPMDPARRAKPLEVELSFTGECLDALRLGELKVTPDPGWKLNPHVQGVSFPRCGHHMMVEVMESYFGVSFRYCGFYGMCEQRPCPAAVTHLQKCHDHNLDISADDDVDYLIQYRHPLGAMVSQFEHRVRLGNSLNRAEDWTAFADATLPQWEIFVQKWVLENHNPRALKVAYNDALADPIAVFGRVAKLFAPHNPVDFERLKRVVRQNKVAARRRLEESRLFDRVFFAALEARVAPTLAALKLPRFFA
jgi:hypothetical protein